MRTFAITLSLLPLAFVSYGAPISFYDGFDNPVLDPAWSVAAGPGAISLTARPGYLQYSLTSSTHPNTPPLRLSRPFDGTDWLFEMEVDYTFGSGNGRQQFARIFFGSDPLTATSQILWFRTKDDFGGGSATGEVIAGGSDGGTGLTQSIAAPYASDTHFVRIQRAGQDLTVFRSPDGIIWQAFLAYTFTDPLGNEQVLQLTGLQFAGGQLGTAEYNYVSLQAAGVPEPGTFGCLLAGLGVVTAVSAVRRR
jgi:hypothetical protein